MKIFSISSAFIISMIIIINVVLSNRSADYTNFYNNQAAQYNYSVNSLESIKKSIYDSLVFNNYLKLDGLDSSLNKTLIDSIGIIQSVECFLDNESNIFYSNKKGIRNNVHSLCNINGSVYRTAVSVVLNANSKILHSPKYYIERIFDSEYFRYDSIGFCRSNIGTCGIDVNCRPIIASGFDKRPSRVDESNLLKLKLEPNRRYQPIWINRFENRIAYKTIDDIPKSNSMRECEGARMHYH